MHHYSHYWKTEFVWTWVHQHTFDQIKLHVSNDVKLQFYDANKPLYTEVDMSKKDIGTVMLQEDNIMKMTQNLKFWQISDPSHMQVRPCPQQGQIIETQSMNF